jgi:hypothetical protein
MTQHKDVRPRPLAQIVDEWWRAVKRRRLRIRRPDEQVVIEPDTSKLPEEGTERRSTTFRDILP